MKKKHKLFYASIQWMVIWLVALTSLPAYAENPEEYIPNASGGLRIGVALRDKTIVLLDEPALLKTAFDLGWGRLREELNRHIVHFIHDVGEQGAIEVASDLATIDRAELRVMKIDNGVSLKYILHDSQMRLALSWQSLKLSYVVNFDIEMVLAMQASNQGQWLQVADAAISIQDTRINGEDLLSRLMLPLIEALFQEVQKYMEQAANALLPLMREISDPIILLFSPDPGQIPNDAIYTDIRVEPNGGTVVFCFKSNAKNTCRFPTMRK